jgi:hypothetical protein
MKFRIFADTHIGSPIEILRSEVISEPVNENTIFLGDIIDLANCEKEKGKPTILKVKLGLFSQEEYLKFRNKVNATQKVYRSKNNYLKTKKYEKSKKGFLVRCYRNMKSRVLGIQKLKYHLYGGLEILNKKDFYAWSIDNKNFNLLFTNWEKSNYLKKLTPSIDRIDSSKGYVLKNMQWITHSENSRRGSLSKKRKQNEI